MVGYHGILTGESFENNFYEVTSNDEVLDQNIDYKDSTIKGSMFNLQNLRNVRESYNRHHQDEDNLRDIDKAQMLMMF